MVRTLRGSAGSALLLSIVGCGVGSIGDTGQPVVSFSATPGLIAPGQTSTLEWTVTGARAVTIDNGVGEVSASGTLAVSPNVTTVYTLTAVGGSGSTSASATVSILQPPSVELTATPATVFTGGTSTLTWSVTGATSIAIDQGIGAVDASGQRSVTPSTTTTYTLTAVNSIGATTAQVTVTVAVTPHVTFTASPATIAAGGTSTLSWSVTAATSITIDQGVGTVAATGTRDVTPAATTIYTLTATNDAGSTTATATVTIGATGWLYTKAGVGKIYVQKDGAETVWIGRGVNLDDLLFCGYNYGLWMSNPTGGEALLAVAENLVSQWKPTFVRLSLGMSSYQPVMSWTSNPAQYRDPMLAVVQALGAHPGVYVLVTVRSDASMDCPLDEATCLPTASTDAVYEALVTDFKDAPYVLFGVANEPGGNTLANATIRASMSHVVDVIRAKEDALGTPHHIVVVQGNSWTSSIGFYSTSPLTQDNVAYEYHSYPPSASGYTYSNIPVIIGEYGPTSSSSTLGAAFFTDLEAKQLPSAAWDFDPYNDCAPDLLSVNHSSTTFVTTPWGAQVKAYLAAH